MNKDFPRIISVLRREKGLSQKVVSQNLNISQALLSHYEKGIRECGLDFVVKISNYYGVSCDYLLGKTSDRHGRVLAFDEPPELNESSEIESSSGNTVMTMLNKKFIVGSVNIICNILIKLNNKRLTKHVTMYLMTAVYKTFRALLRTNPNYDSDEFFRLNDSVSDGFCDGAMNISFAKCIAEVGACAETDNYVDINQTTLSLEYPDHASALTSLIQNTEKLLKDEIES